MNIKPFKPFVFLLVLMAVVSLACQALTGSPTPEPVPPPVQEEPQQPTLEPEEQPAQTQEPQQEPPTSNNDYIIFTDRNNHYQIEVPGDWIQSEDSGESYYIDQFKSPDGNALIENLVYDDGDPFTGKSNGKFALGLLHTFYSNTGEEGDIRISDDKLMPDGSERLSWSSREGGYSGMSFFEVRNKTTFLMFTVEWLDDAEADYVDILNRAIESYVVP
jgi:hypothetical protein